MAHISKKIKLARSKVDRDKVYSLQEGLGLVKASSFVKFDESVDVNCMLGIKAERSDQVVRGGLQLPHFFGKPIKVLAFVKGEQEEVARKAGAEYVGAEDLVKKIVEEGWCDFDYAVATPDLMGLVGKAAKVLGPLGKLPNKKNNTVALDVGDIIKELKSGLRFFKNDSAAQVHFSFGKISFSIEKLQENFIAFHKALLAAKPAASKGLFIRKIVIASTMGPGIKISL